MNKHKYLTPFLLFLTFLIINSCSTQKNTFVNRTFHSTTTKYNGYFNARESYRDGLKRLDELHEDNYEDVLSIFRYGSTQQLSTVAGNMETAYQKSSTAIRRHSMNIKGIEYNKWIDDSYYLIARSHYFKQDFNLAILTFQYIIRQFQTPIAYKSKVWIAKSYIKAEQYGNALKILELIKQDIEAGLLDNETLLLYNMVYAHYYLQQRNFAGAIPYLEKTTQFATKRKAKTRLTFILAQAQHEEENYAQAQQSYARVLKLNPDFQMAFQARINMAMAFDTKTGDSNFILGELNKMLRDNKNKEFRDQIYYALAQFYMRQNMEAKAIENYNLALENYKDNRSQKGVTFLRLAEISFNKKNYVEAAQLYDSTMTYLSQEYPSYTDAGQKSQLLNELSTNLIRIEHQDSLQRLASMNPDQRNAILDAIIAQIEEEDRLEKEREQERALMRQQMARAGRNQSQAGSDEGWYFYNQSAKSFGQNEFYAKWGERELADLWRISNKRVMAFNVNGEILEDSISNQSGGKVTRASLMETIPTTPEKLENSYKQIASAYYNVALIFKDRLKDNQAAIEYFEALINRFPDNENKLLSAYFLHNIFDQTSNSTRANIYKNMIIREFPETDFAKILSDPSYRYNMIERQNRVQNLYSQAYNAYSAGNYTIVTSFYAQALQDSLEISKEDQAKFNFLHALVLAKTNQMDSLVKKLTFLTENFTETQVHVPATNLLAYLDDRDLISRADDISKNNSEAGSGDNIPLNELSNESSIFSFNPDAVHFYVFVVNTREVQIRQIRGDLNSYNNANYIDNKLNMSTLFFDSNKQLITVTNFANATDALKYGQQIKTELLAKDYSETTFDGFAISVENYPVFYQERKLDEYIEFFNYSYSRLE